ncbi:MAG: transcriptional regulator, partial [Pseudomonadota bacterium]
MLDRIKASLSSLAPAEQRVGRLVLSDPRAFANLPITELAVRSHVSK